MRISVVTSVGLFVLAASLSAQQPPAGGGQGRGPQRPPLTLTTTAWPDGDLIPVKHTQAGDQISPALNWTNVPEGTQSFVLHMRDPDVARNRGTEDQVHWLVWNIPERRRVFRRMCRRAHSSRTAAAKSARAARCTAVRARRPPVRSITTRSSCTRSIRRSTCPPAAMPGTHVQKSGPQCRDTCWARRCTWDCSGGRSSQVSTCNLLIPEP